MIYQVLIFQYTNGCFFLVSFNHLIFQQQESCKDNKIPGFLKRVNCLLKSKFYFKDIRQLYNIIFVERGDSNGLISFRLAADL